MIADIWTIAWKEWKELLLNKGSVRGGLTRIALMVAVFGGVLPLQTGRAWVTSPISLLYWAWVPLFLVVGMIADSFAGERERHTLETLLASRMPDRPILFGKVTAAVGYGWGLGALSLLVGLVAVNLAYGHGQILLYPATVVVSGAVLGVLAATLAAAAGVIVSLRAPTVRQAAQTMSLAMAGIFLLPTLVIGALPALLPKLLPFSSVAQFEAFLGGMNWTAVLVGLGALLAAIDAGLLRTAMNRFQRARLILD